MHLFFDIETTGLNVFENRIIAICIQRPDSDVPVTFYGEDERKIINQFWEAAEDSILFGFNSASFDIPFIIRRSIILGVRLKTFKQHFDLRKIANCFSYSNDKYCKGKLSDWALVLGYIPKTHNGENMVEFYNNKKWKEIKNHVEEDVFITKLLFNRLKDVDLI